MVVQSSSLLILFLVVALPACLAWWLWARAQDRAADSSAEQGELLTGREAVARHMFGESCGWSRLDMLSYDRIAAAREPWLQLADERLARSKTQAS